MLEALAHDDDEQGLDSRGHPFEARPRTAEQSAIVEKLEVAPTVFRGRSASDLGLRFHAIVSHTADWAHRTLVPADGTPIPADDFYVYIWENAWLKTIKARNPSTRLLKRAARDKAVDFWRLAENAPLGLVGLNHRKPEHALKWPVIRAGERAEGRDTEEDAAGDDTRGRGDEFPDRRVPSPEFRMRLAEAFGALSLRQRQVAASLWYGCTLRETATILSISLKTAHREKIAAQTELHEALGARRQTPERN